MTDPCSSVDLSRPTNVADILHRGWDIFETHRDDLRVFEIEKCDDSDKFDTDEAAIKHIIHDPAQAAQCISELLEILKIECNRPEPQATPPVNEEATASAKPSTFALLMQYIACKEAHYAADRDMAKAAVALGEAIGFHDDMDDVAIPDHGGHFYIIKPDRGNFLSIQHTASMQLPS